MTEVLLREGDENRVSHLFDAAGIKFPPFFREIRMAEPEETKEKPAVPKTVWILGMVSLLMDIIVGDDSSCCGRRIPELPTCGYRW